MQNYTIVSKVSDKSAALPVRSKVVGQPNYLIMPQVTTHLKDSAPLKAATDKPWGQMTGNVAQASSTTKNEQSKSGLAVQRKMILGQPNDRYEQEADHLAPRIVRQINTPGFDQQSPSSSKGHTPSVQLKALRPTLQLKGAIATEPVSPATETAIARARGSGQPIELGLQQRMGQALGADFSHVRVHTGTQSDQLNQSLQAKAFTTGQDIFFRQGAYQPRSQKGQELIAHELTHVVQQQGDAYIQRAIGMEFECSQLEILSPLNVRKGDIIQEQKTDHWSMQVEETAAGGPKVVEFVVDPAADDLQQLDRAVNGMVFIADRLKDGQPQWISGYQLQHTSKEYIEAAIQITMGVPLADIPSLYDEYLSEGATLVRGSDTKSKAYEHFEDINKEVPMIIRRVSRVEVPGGGGFSELPPELKGFILLLMDYIRQGYVPPSFIASAKINFAKALYPLMARTNFTAIYKLLPDEQKDILTELAPPLGIRRIKPEWAMWIVNEALGDVLGATGEQMDSVMKSGMIQQQIRGPERNNRVPSRQGFIESIPGEDKLSNAYPMGIGALKDKMDHDSDGNAVAPIFELRKPFGSSVRHPHWKALAKESWERYMKIVHNNIYTVNRHHLGRYRRRGRA